jgi:hypothetical protein
VPTWQFRDPAKCKLCDFAGTGKEGTASNKIASQGRWHEYLTGKATMPVTREIPYKSVKFPLDTGYKSSITLRGMIPTSEIQILFFSITNCIEVKGYKQ